MKQSPLIERLAKALVAVQSELRAVAKDATNPHFKSRFASLDAIIEQVRPVLAKHDLAVVQGATTPESDANSHLVAITVETVLVHSSGEWLSSSVIIPLAKADPQGAGAALTYGRRYSLSSLLCLATDEDDDGNAASKQRAQRSEGGKAGRERATAGGGQQAASETRPPATAQPTFTRDSTWPATPHLDVAVRDLPDVFIKWAVEPGRKLGVNTDAWQKVLRQELVTRATNGAKVGA